jgi:hypothetical protein
MNTGYVIEIFSDKGKWVRSYYNDLEKDHLPESQPMEVFSDLGRRYRRRPLDPLLEAMAVATQNLKTSGNHHRAAAKRRNTPSTRHRPKT